MKLSYFIFFYLILGIWSLNKNSSAKKLLRSGCPINCSTCKDGYCVECLKGYYFYENMCYSLCPDYTYADNYSMTCKLIKENPVYIKAFTMSKCLNSCGKKFNDCSCEINCKREGTCCSDYDYCNTIEENVQNINTVVNCSICSSDIKCLQCEEGFYMFNSNCYNKCPIGSKSYNDINKLCIEDNSKSSIEYCALYDDNSNNLCKQCNDQYYLLNNNQCVTECPISYIADKEFKKCVPSSDISNINLIILDLAYYWNYPTKQSCRNKCEDDDLQNECK
jgi:proprotein convertase subtilisin/kexin type 5